MASEDVRILAIRGNTLLVESSVASACGGCRSKSSCGQGGSKPHEIQVIPEVAERLKVQDMVSVGLPSGELLRVILSVYVPPLCGLMLGVLPSLAGGSDAVTVLGGAIGLGVGLLVTRTLGKIGRPIVYSVGNPATVSTVRTGCSD
jgi:sigma-E factor negative regulatory protein RseC